MPENEQLNPEELQVKALTTTPVDEVDAEGKIMEGVEDVVVDTTEDDLNVKTYLKVSPTFYIKAVETEEVDAEGELLEMFKILNPETEVVEERELTNDEKKELFIQQLKVSRKVFNPLSHPTKVVGKTTLVNPHIEKRKRVVKEKETITNITMNKFGADYKKKRQTRNKQAKKSRKANR